MAIELKRRPGWIVCRNRQEIPVPSVDVLPRWAELGRIRPDDYLVNPLIESCVLACDVPDLRAAFREARVRKVKAMLRVFWPWA